MEFQNKAREGRRAALAGLSPRKDHFAGTPSRLREVWFAAPTFKSRRG